MSLRHLNTHKRTRVRRILVPQTTGPDMMPFAISSGKTAPLRHSPSPPMDGGGEGRRYSAAEEVGGQSSRGKGGGKHNEGITRE